MPPRSPMRLPSPLHLHLQQQQRRRQFRQKLLVVLMAGITLVFIYFQDTINTEPLFMLPISQKQQHEHVNSGSRNSLATVTMVRSTSTSTASSHTTPLHLRNRPGKTESSSSWTGTQVAGLLEATNMKKTDLNLDPALQEDDDDNKREQDNVPDTSDRTSARSGKTSNLDSEDSVDPADKNPAQLEKQVREATADAMAQAEAAAFTQQKQEENDSSNNNNNNNQEGLPVDKEQRKSIILREQDFPERPVSPYEQRWPRYMLPSWASKPFYFRKKSYPKRVCFVHVGKAAGSSVGCSLGFQLHCSSEYIYPHGVLPSLTTNIIHNDVNDCSLDMDYYMFTMRNPVERIKSWWLYDINYLDHLRNSPEDGGCGFDTLEVFTEFGLQQQLLPRDADRECHKMALRVIRGEQKMGNHAYHNYRYYLNQVPNNATITVIRAEHMLDDWNAMERLLGSKAAVGKLPSKNENKKYDPRDKYVSEQGLKHLCAALCEEIQVYKHILSRAANLNQHQVDESIHELRQVCPYEVDQAGCPR